MTKNNNQLSDFSAGLVSGGMLVAAFLIIFAVTPMSVKIDKQQSFIAENYNFSESECVNVSPKMYIATNLTTGKDMVLTDKQFSHYLTSTDFYLGTITTIESKCLQYCHTRQIQDGEDCIRIGNVFECPTKDPWSCNFIENVSLPFYCEPKNYFCRVVDVRENCTPKFKTEQYGCVDASVVNQAREAIK